MGEERYAGENRGCAETHTGMTPPPKSPDPQAAVAELAGQLLGCGAVLSQIVSYMVKTQAEGKSAPDAAPIPTVAHELVGGAIADLARRHSDEELKAAAEIVREATDAICNDIFVVAP
ncbi:MAG: hypothetical protein QOF83_3826 [Solirubrobacteraceae bacterium]|nr:hypothetical protein [Solirubrobacteraceae bacterium]